MSPLYEYYCPCGVRFEKIKPMPERKTEACPECGELAENIISHSNHTFGWELDEQSHIKGHKDNWVRAV